MENGGFRPKSWYPKLSKSWMIVLKPMISGIPGFCHVSVLRWVMEHRPDRVSKKESKGPGVYAGPGWRCSKSPLLGGFMGKYVCCWHRFEDWNIQDEQPEGLRQMVQWSKQFLMRATHCRSPQLLVLRGDLKSINISMFSTHGESDEIPSGKRLHNYGKSPPCLMGKSTISMAIFNSYFDITRG